MKRHIISAALILSSLTAFAGPPPVPEITPSTNEWSYRIALYGWAQSLDGTVGVRGVHVETDISFSDIIEDLDMAMFFGTEIRHGRWGLLADFNYAEVRGAASTPFGIAFSRVEVETKQFIGNVAVAYRLMEDQSFTLDVYGGMRVNWIDSEISLTGNAVAFNRLNRTVNVRNRSISGDEVWVDPIIGLRANYNISEKVYLRGLGDIGGFGLGSDFSWQLMGLVGYRFSENCSGYLGYRGLGSDFSDGGFVYDVVSHGPVIGVDFKF